MTIEVKVEVPVVEEPLFSPEQIAWLDARYRMSTPQLERMMADDPDSTVEVSVDVEA